MLRQLADIGMMHHLPGLQDADAIGDCERAVEMLFDRQDRQPLALET